MIVFILPGINIASAVEFIEDFIGPELHPYLQVTADAGYSFGIEDGRGVFEKAEGIGSGIYFARTNIRGLGQRSRKLLLVR